MAETFSFDTVIDMQIIEPTASICRL